MPHHEHSSVKSRGTHFFAPLVKSLHTVKASQSASVWHSSPQTAGASQLVVHVVGSVAQSGRIPPHESHESG